MAEPSLIAWGLAAAVGSGLLIGLERERRKGRGASRRAAGFRSFTLAALGGGLAQVIGGPLLVALGAVLVGALAVLAYRHSLQAPPPSATPANGDTIDPGLTTELALFVTYLVGVLCVQSPALGAGCAAVVAVLLAARERLHRLATQSLTQAEADDALLLAALALVLLPLAPAEPLALLGGLAPRLLLLTVLLILTLQAAGHVALRLFGPRAGLALSGLMSGFVSSTATIASLGTRARAEPELARACLAGALASTGATWVQALMLVAALSPGALVHVLPIAATGAAVAWATAGAAWWRARGDAPGGPAPDSRGPLRLREALVVAAMLAVVSLVVNAAQARFGEAGLMVGTALAALADAHAPMAALATMHGAGQLADGSLGLGIAGAACSNALVRGITAFVAGGARYGTAVAASLACSSGAALAVAAMAA